MKLFDTTLTRLEQSLDVRLVRHNVLAGTLANADTPGYRPVDVDFGATMEQLASAPQGSQAERSPLENAGASAVIESLPGTPGIDGNAVDADRALVAVAENALQYGASARTASKKLAILRYVASDGAA